ncbi:recombination mediator RecR [Dermabacter hominis]|uniref:recombination mediator RecR n=1 Tax=Dermabacter hominis TaxID=36740 RepID=UPI000773B361|nr:recombination mediator RecR [Dermabacter hominis]
MFQGIVQDLIDELGMLPGVGPKSAQRIAFYVLGAESASIERLASTLTEVKKRIRFCEVCGNIAEEERCAICLDERRNGELLCVVEEPRDVFAIERLREYRGRYHVLGGAIDPIGGVGPADLRIQELQDRVSQGDITEVILALDPNVQGEATSSYIARALADSGVEVTRLASGLPVGGDLDYADEMTLGRAFAGRRTF